MKLAFIFDTVLLENENKDYYAVNLNYRLWKDRYLPVFDQIIVSTRVKKISMNEISLKKGYTISNGENVQILPISQYSKIPDLIFKRKKIKEQIKQVLKQVDKVIIRMPSPLGSFACNICRKEKKPYAIEMVADPWEGYRHHTNPIGKIIAPFMYFSTKKQCKKAKRVLYVTKHSLQKRYPTLGVSTNASNVMIHESPHEVLENRLLKIEKTNDYTLGMVGALDIKYKGHSVLIKALKELTKKYPNLKLELLGDGNKSKLEKLIRKYNIEHNVVFKGTLPGGEPVLIWMDSIDIICVPSFTEGLPRVLIEAMSRGCPAVGSKIGGIPELIEDEVLHKRGNYVKLSNDIEKIISNKEYAIELAKKNFETAKQYAKEKLDGKRKQFWIDFRDND